MSRAAALARRGAPAMAAAAADPLGATLGAGGAARQAAASGGGYVDWETVRAPAREGGRGCCAAPRGACGPPRGDGGAVGRVWVA